MVVLASPVKTLAPQKTLLSFLEFFNHAITAGVKNWRVMQSQGPIMITVSCVEAPPKVMSCLAAGAEGKSRVAGSCPLYYVDVCGPWVMAQRVSALPSTCKHTRTQTHTCLSILARAQGMPTHQLACVPARWVREAWAEANGDNQCGLSCLSCSFMLSLSVRPLGTRVCVRRVCCLIGGENFMLLSDGAL